MKILVLCYEYPPLGGGGGRVAKGIAEALAARGHEVRVQTAGLGFRSTREEHGGVKVFRTASLRRREDRCAVHEMALYCVTSFRPSLQHVTRWKPDVIHAHFAMPTGMLAWAVHGITKIPYVLTAHLGDVPGGVPDQTDGLFRMVDPVARRVWAAAAGRTAVSSFVQELAERAYRLPVTRILNGIALPHTEPYAPLPTSRTLRLVFVGRFHPQKNAPFLIDALALLRDLDWQLTMIGDGPDSAAIRVRIEAHGLADRVQLLGWRSAAEVQQILAGSDVLCMPSLSEGMPLAAVEALAHGLAIAGSDIPGLRDVLADGVNGTATPVNDAPAFAAAVRRMVLDPAFTRRLRLASREKARAFDLEGIVTAYEAVLTAAARK